MKETDGALTPSQVASFRKQFAAERSNRLMQNAVANVTIDQIALDRDLVTTMDHSFSHKLDDWSVTNQKKSGRCWAFAGMNLLRVGARDRMKLKDFEFSQNYVLFWDKLEKSNYFFENIIATADRDLDDRDVAFLLQRPLDDGGQWNMFVNVIRKHGLVPKTVMPETESSSNTRRMNQAVIRKLRDGASVLREMIARGERTESVREAKEELLAVIHRILSIHLGTPPASFDWQWNDKDSDFQRRGEMTPQEFVAEFVEIPVDDFVCLVHDPRNPTGKTYTVRYLGNVVGGIPVAYLNVDLATMKAVAVRTIQDGEPVWMGCDVGPMMDRTAGLWDAKLFDYDGVYDTTFGLDKAGRLLHGESFMTHAMLFTGVDVDEDKPRRWRVENSWGDKVGQKGFYLMNDSWFDEYMFEIAARKSYLPTELLAAFEAEPTVLPPWDPMGSLA